MLFAVLVLVAVFVVFITTKMQNVAGECFDFDEKLGVIKRYNIDLDGCSVDVKIPEKLKGKTVETIGASAFRKANIKSVDIPPTVKKIQAYAFADNEIQTLRLSDGLEVINSQAFANNQISTLEIPDTVDSIMNDAFRDNPLVELTIGENVKDIGNGAFSSSIYLQTLIIKGDSERFNAQWARIGFTENIKATNNTEVTKD